MMEIKSLSILCCLAIHTVSVAKLTCYSASIWNTTLWSITLNDHMAIVCWPFKEQLKQSRPSSANAAPMEASPLTRQPQPEVFTPKITLLYAELFKVRLAS